MSLVTVPEGLYCQVIRRLNHDDEALEGFDERTGEYSRALREKYARYRWAVGLVVFTNADDILKELKAAGKRERAFRGVPLVHSQHAFDIVDTFVEEFCKESFLLALKYLIQDQNFKLEFEDGAFTLYMRQTPLYKISTPEGGTLRVENNRILDIEGCDNELFGAERQAAAAQLQRALESESATMSDDDDDIVLRKNVLRSLLWKSSLFSTSPTSLSAIEASYRLR